MDDDRDAVYADADDFTLGELFHQVADDYDAMLLAARRAARARGDGRLERAYLDEARDLTRRLGAIGARDRDAQIAAIRGWDSRMDELTGLSHVPA